MGSPGCGSPWSGFHLSGDEMTKTRRDAYEIVSPDMVRHLLDYDPDTGILTWRKRFPETWRNKAFNSNFAGKVAGGKTVNGYITVAISVSGKTYPFYAHVLVWAHTYGNWPDGNIDHRDRDTLNNRVSNLRDSSQSQNMGNSTIKACSGNPFKGIRRSKNGSSWSSQIFVRGERIYLGTFQDPVSAAQAYDAAARRYFGDFARTNVDLGLLAA